MVSHRSFSSFKHTEGLHHRNSACLTVRPSVSAVVCVVCSVTVSISLYIRVFVTLTRVRVCVSRSERAQYLRWAPPGTRPGTAPEPCAWPRPGPG